MDLEFAEGAWEEACLLMYESELMPYGDLSEECKQYRQIRHPQDSTLPLFKLSRELSEEYDHLDSRYKKEEKRLDDEIDLYSKDHGLSYMERKYLKLFCHACHQIFTTASDRFEEIMERDGLLKQLRVAAKKDIQTKDKTICMSCMVRHIFTIVKRCVAEPVPVEEIVGFVMMTFISPTSS